MNQLPQGQDLYAYLDQLYGKLGRDPDTAGIQWWMDNAGQYTGQGGLAQLENMFMGAARNDPTDGAYLNIRQMAPGATDLTQAEASQWGDYMNAAAAEQRGMANMPFVAPSTASLNGMHPDHIWQTYFRSPEEQKAVMQSMANMWQTDASSPATTPKPTQTVTTNETEAPKAGFGALGFYRDR